LQLTGAFKQDSVVCKEQIMATHSDGLLRLYVGRWFRRNV